MNDSHRFGLRARLATIAAVLIVETIALSMLIQGSLGETSGIATIVHSTQHWLFRLLIAYAAAWMLLLVLRRDGGFAAQDARFAAEPVRPAWLVGHAACLVPLAFLSSLLYRGSPGLPFVPLAAGWHLCAVGTLVTLFAAMGPARAWRSLWRQSAPVAAYAAVPAVAAVLVIQWSQRLWTVAAQLTFDIVAALLGPMLPALRVDPAQRILATPRFAVQVAEVCSGLEGVGLMLVFCCGWLWYCRREFRFPRALVMIPVALLLVFLLNSLRIAAIVLIGDAGHARLAMIGFHSQAGWIAFNLVALGVAVAARHSRWLSAAGAQPIAAGAPAPEPNPVSPYLMPLLATLAVGMIVHALSSGFDVLYPLRPLAAGLVLWHYRARYRGLDWRFSWRGVAAGIVIFAVWIALGHWLVGPASMPAELAALPDGGRWSWIGVRVLAAAVTVPVAEELAYRGFLLRRCATARFDAIRFSDVRWPALLLSSVLFGAAHGTMWIAGTLAGLACGLVCRQTNRIGEAVAAHATGNALLAAAVLSAGQWQWW